MQHCCLTSCPPYCPTPTFITVTTQYNRLSPRSTEIDYYFHVDIYIYLFLLTKNGLDVCSPVGHNQQMQRNEVETIKHKLLYTLNNYTP